MTDVDVDAFVDPAPLRRAVPDLAYPKAAGPKAELWLKGQSAIRTFDSPAALLRAVKGASVRAAYVPDAVTGTLWFAERAVWVADGAEWRAFVTRSGAERYVSGHSGARVVPYADAVRLAS